MDLSTIASAGGGIMSGIIGSLFGNKLSKRQIDAAREANQANIAAQERINAANIANQNRINQQNIDFQKDINSIMRRDSLNAISNKKSDLARAGYSTAAPDLQGFSTASLSSPNQLMAQQQSPIVNPEYTSDNVNSIIGTVNSAMSIFSNAAKLKSEIDLNRANAKSQNANATGKEIDNDFRIARNEAELEQIYKTVDDLVASKDLKRGQAHKIGYDIDNISTATQLLSEQINQARFVTKTQEERFNKEMQKLCAEIVDIKSAARLKDSQSAINDIEKRIKEIEKNFAEFGINFNSNDLVSAFARLALSPKGSQIIPRLANFVVDSISNTANAIVNDIIPKSISSLTERGKDGVPNVLRNAFPLQYGMFKLFKKTKKFF